MIDKFSLPSSNTTVPNKLKPSLLTKILLSGHWWILGEQQLQITLCNIIKYEFMINWWWKIQLIINFYCNNLILINKNLSLMKWPEMISKWLGANKPEVWSSSWCPLFSWEISKMKEYQYPISICCIDISVYKLNGTF